MRYALFLLLPALLFGAQTQDWKTGKVLDSATAKTYVQTGDQSTVPVAIFQSVTIRDTQLVIASDEFAYLVEDTRTQGGFSTVHGAIIYAVSGRHHGCRATALGSTRTKPSSTSSTRTARSARPKCCSRSG